MLGDEDGLVALCGWGHIANGQWGMHAEIGWWCNCNNVITVALSIWSSRGL